MEDIRVYKYGSDIPVDERLSILDFKDSDIFMNETFRYREGYYCLLLMEHGEATVSVNGCESSVKSPVIICGLPGEAWHWKKLNKVRGKFICFEAPFILAGLNGGFSLEPISFLNSGNHYPFIPLSYTRYHKLRELVYDLEDTMLEYPVFYDLLRVQLWQFIFLTEKEYMLNRNQGRQKDTKNHIVEFISLVAKHYNENHDTLFYAEKLNITPNYLNKICKNFLGINAHTYIANHIVGEAKVLLRLTDININELAFRLGFENTNYFIKYFKKIDGITPGEYKKKDTFGQ